ARLAPRTVDQLLPVDDSDARAREVELVVAIDARKLGRLAADQHAARVPAHRRGALDELGDLVEVDARRRHVVEEEERVGARGDHVVDAVRREIHSCPAQTVGTSGEDELRADAVSRSGKEAAIVERVKPGERAEAGGARGLDGPAQPLYDLLGLGERDPGGVIGPALPAQRPECTTPG